MPKAARLTDIGSSHGCFPPTPIISGSGDVSINGLAAARKGDSLIPHGCGNCPPHGRSISAGSATVSINGKPAARVADGIGCGGSVSTGSGDTLIGDVGTGGALKSCMEGAGESASAFVKVDFEAFPISEEAKKVARFTMAVYGGPRALDTHVMEEAQSLIRGKLQHLQGAAFDPALAGLGIGPDTITQEVMQSAANGATLQDSMIAQVSKSTGGTSLASHLAQMVQPELAGSLVRQATMAMRSGRVAPDALMGSVLPGAGAVVPGETTLGSAIGTVAKAVSCNGTSPETAATALAPSLAAITDEAAQTGVAEFMGQVSATA